MIAIFLALVLTIVSLNDFITTANFMVNKASITEQHCINKDKPELACEGKCFLSKLFKKNKEKSQHNPNAQKEENVNTVYLLPIVHLVLGYELNTNNANHNFYNSMYLDVINHDIDHPPQLG